ncbi:MAG: prephenate dehydrogenase [Eubacteriales bacterium]
MDIGIVGLGLIGGSLAKAIKKNTPHRVFGLDIDVESLKKAFLTGAVDGELKDLGSLDMLIVALYPAATVRYVTENADKIDKKCIVMDVSGVKGAVCGPLFPLAREKGFTFIGGHPMAGVEFSGFDHAREALFKNASMVLVPDKNVTIDKLVAVKELFTALGFARMQVSTAEEHDKMIALTSQLAHVLSSAYVKSPSAVSHKGFSAGSFRDMTRVAKLNEDMWCELFFDNRENLLGEIDGLIARLSEYRAALYERDGDEMKRLLKEGREKKALAEKNYEKTQS